MSSKNENAIHHRVPEWNKNENTLEDLDEDSFGGIDMDLDGTRKSWPSLTLCGASAPREHQLGILPRL